MKGEKGRNEMNKKNKWKIAFIVLLAANLAILASLGLLLFLSGEQEPVPEQTADEQPYAEFLIQSGKKDLTKLINHYIEKEGLNGPINYEVLLNDEVELYGEVKFFSQMLQLKMTFEPEALENGDLILRQKTVSLGDVKLPVAYILKFIKDSYKLPEWVIIQPNDKQVYVALQKMELNNGIHVRAQEFNLKEDIISLKMLVPADE
ncbi:MAG TPA: YpmS family protein [Bacillaceae bacterium]